MTLEDLRTTRTKSGWYGVYLDARCVERPWRAMVRNAQGEEILLGYFKCPMTAARKVLKSLRIIEHVPYTRPRRHCKNAGHPLVESNLFVYRQGTKVMRYCRRCRQQWQAAWYAQRKQKKAEGYTLL